MVKGIINNPAAKLLTPCIMSKTAPVEIHKRVSSKFKPKKSACAGAYSKPNANPCSAHTVGYIEYLSHLGIFLGKIIVIAHKTAQI